VVNPKKAEESKLWRLSDAFGLNIADSATRASPYKVTLVKDTLDACFLKNVPEKIIDSMAYGNDSRDKAS
jgi:hypothetical protein